MRKVPLYSSSSRPRAATSPEIETTVADAAPAIAPTGTPPAAKALGSRWSAPKRLLSHPLPWVAASAVLALLLAQATWLAPVAQKLTQKDIDSAVLHTLENATLPSPATRAYEAVRRSVVLVRSGCKFRSPMPDERRKPGTVPNGKPGVWPKYTPN